MGRVLGVDPEDAGLVRIGGKRTEPGEFQRVELDVRRSPEARLRNAAVELTNRAAVARGDVIEMVRRDEAPRPGHVLDDDVRCAGDEPSDVSRHEAASEII